ncbi:MAG TPA: hypothetical protein DCE44_13105 [Verrucomicrobiales bacterium]|nr:hypothetical protein [Verrucomicrobiales bacterium]
MVAFEFPDRGDNGGEFRPRVHSSRLIANRIVAANSIEAVDGGSSLTEQVEIRKPGAIRKQWEGRLAGPRCRAPLPLLDSALLSASGAGE